MALNDVCKAPSCGDWVDAYLGGQCESIAGGLAANAELHSPVLAILDDVIGGIGDQSMNSSAISTYSWHGKGRLCVDRWCLTRESCRVWSDINNDLIGPTSAGANGWLKRRNDVLQTSSRG